MPRHLIAIIRPTGNGWERCEVGSFLANCYIEALSGPDTKDFIGDIIDMPVGRFPTNVGRNVAVAECLKRGVDYMLMVDTDASPAPDTFRAFFKFLREQPVPSVVAAPYTNANGEIMVFHFKTKQPRNTPLDIWEITNYNRDLASMKSGFERVSSIGTHCIMFDMRCFKGIPKPYFRYGYDEDETAVLETEDCWCLRHFFAADIPVFCAWDFPAAHYKELRLEIPHPIHRNQIQQFLVEKAEYIVRAEMAGVIKKEPHKNGNQPWTPTLAYPSSGGANGVVEPQRTAPLESPG